MGLQIPKANRPLSTVSEDTPESRAARVFWSLSEGPRGRGGQWHRPTAPEERAARVLCWVTQAGGLLNCPFFPIPVRCPEWGYGGQSPGFLTQVT